jgi:DNA-binding YbaB/EbfC family protein
VRLATPSVPDPLKPLRTRRWLTEARRKAIHLSFIILPLNLLFQALPWPRSKSEWRVLLILLCIGALALDLLRIHERNVKKFFKRFFGGLIREHEEFGLLGSTYLLIAVLLAVEIFPREIAAAAIGFTVLGDAFAAMVGKAWGRTPFLGKTVEGTAGGGAVTVKATGTGKILEIKIKKEAIDPEDAETLEDLVLAAVNSALQAAEELAKSKMNLGALGDLGSMGLGF